MSDVDPTLTRVLREQVAFERDKQAGVITWAQLTSGGWTTNDVRRSVRRHELVRIHPSVYVDHTGPLSPAQRGWAAVLWAGDAALCGPSVLGVPADALEVHLAVSARRRLEAPEGITLRRLAGLERMIRVGTAPPRLSLEHNVLLTIAQASCEAEVVAALAETVGRLGTTTDAVRRALPQHPRLMGPRQPRRLPGSRGPGLRSVGAPAALAAGDGGAVWHRPAARPDVRGERLAHPTQALLSHLCAGMKEPRSLSVTW